jgi:hypothetical protein
MGTVRDFSLLARAFLRAVLVPQVKSRFLRAFWTSSLRRSGNIQGLPAKLRFNYPIRQILLYFNILKLIH